MSTSSSWPDLTALPGVAASVEEARSAVADLRRHPANRRGWPKSAAAAGVRAARASAQLDGGSGVIDPDAEAIGDPVLAGSVRCHSAIVGLAAVWERAPLQALARLHTLAAADLEDEQFLGVPRSDPEVAPRLAGLTEMVTRSGWSAPVVTALVHAEILTIRPFRTANGVIARAAGRLVMISSGLDSQSLSVPEVAHLRREKSYRQYSADYANSNSGAVGQWIVHVCEALVAGAKEGRSIADAGLEPSS